MKKNSSVNFLRNCIKSLTPLPLNEFLLLLLFEKLKDRPHAVLEVTQDAVPENKEPFQEAEDKTETTFKCWSCTKSFQVKLCQIVPPQEEEEAKSEDQVQIKKLVLRLKLCQISCQMFPIYLKLLQLSETEILKYLILLLLF